MSIDRRRRQRRVLQSDLLQPQAPEISVPEALRVAPVLARYAADAWMRAAEWSVGTWFHAASRMARAAAAGESPSALLEMTKEELREYSRQLLGIADIEARLWRIIAPEATASTIARDAPADASAEALRSRGAQLLRRSADVHAGDDTHPAYARILTELAPDEARILRFFAREGPQPSVDVRTSRPLNLGTQMVGSGLSMIGVQAGCRRPERVPAYLNNLFRLGLIWFSREPVADSLRYQVLEVQPDVLEAKKRGGGGRVVRRSIELTAFGADFCAMCLPPEALEAPPQPKPRPKPRKAKKA
ncbi:MAG TPA: Abi-alpha family protein [Myxococcaceae bacterium]|nr:Abi-alpha family protein [Myxococcaceae bacterium]